MKRNIIFLVAILMTLSVSARMIKVTGCVISNKTPIEFANVVVLTQDSVFVEGSISNEKGIFQIENIPSGKDYRLKISSIGYTAKTVQLSHLSRNTDLGKIEIEENTVALKEVKVTASNVVNALDKKVIHPTTHALKAATNGLDLLQQLKMNRIHVDPLRNTITSSNEGEVQLRINGVKAEIQEVRALNPKMIAHIEYHDEPGLRYGKDVAVVIDYITKRPTSGGYIGVDTQNSPMTGFGNNSLNAKFNHKKSEWNLYYWGMYRRLDGFWRTNLETFNFEDGSSFARKEQGVPTTFNENNHFTKVSYNYQEGKKWFFNANFRFSYRNGNMDYRSWLYPVNEVQNKTEMFDLSGHNSRRPSLDLYFQRNFNDRNVLIFNVVGTYINSKQSRSYMEKKNEQMLTDIASYTKGDKYSLISEAIYEMGIGDHNQLTFGGKHYQTYAKNNYGGSSVATTRMNNGYATAYVQFSGKKGKFKYSAGVQTLYNWNKQGDHKYDKFVILPRVKMGYQFSKSLSLRLNSRLDFNGAGLSQLSDVEQQIDALQFRRGNPNLKTVHRFSNRLNLEYRKGLFSGYINLFYQYQDNPIMEATLREDDRFIRTTMNQNSWQKFNPELSLKYGPIAKVLNLSFTTGFNYFDSKGGNYHHTYNNWYYQAEASALYKKWMFYFQMQNQKNDFYGETLTMGEEYHVLGINYRFKNGNIGLMTLNPFGAKNSYNRPTENYNRFAPYRNVWYLRDSARLYVVTFSWNINFGRKYKSSRKRLSNEDTNIGALKSGK
jgi:hypothetical protein